jgi:hypothetical protein
MRLSKYLFLFGSADLLSKLIGEERAWVFVEKIVKRKKLNWLKKNKNKVKYEKSLIDQAIDVFIKCYFKVDIKDIEIIKKNGRKLIMRWRIYCPVLEACEILNLNTRVVCKRAYERPAQEFLNKISPRLRFSRDYEQIRPYAEYCEETIEVVD